jgi:hypothetical protein
MIWLSRISTVLGGCCDNLPVRVRILSFSSSHDGYLARRLMTVRIFARHYQTLDPDSEIPPEDISPTGQRLENAFTCGNT